MALVLVDVDGTLIEGVPCERLFIPYLLAQRMLGPRQLTAFAAFVPRYAARFGRHVLKKDKAYLSGLEVSAVEQAAVRFVDLHLLRRVRRLLRVRLERHAEAGDLVALLTGTPQFIAAPLAARLSIPRAVGALCDQTGDVFTALPPRCHPFAETKVTAAEALCRQLGLPLGECVAYADSIYDLALMERVRRAVAVAPDSALRARAERWDWEILGA